MTRFLYTLLIILLLPYALLHLAWRSRRQPEYLRHIGERFGFYASTPRQPLIWLHAVSVGETRAAQPLIARLRVQFPQHQILITHMTPTGRQTSVELFGDEVLRVYLPYDYPFAVARFLRHFQPQIGIIMETEWWPNLIAACREREVPLLLVNARLSEKSAQRYARWPQLVRDSLKKLSAIAAQTQTDAARLQALGAAGVEIFGNLKFDLEPPPSQLAAGAALRAAIGARPALLAASTREGEEALILDALQTQPPGQTLLIIVPRHPQRFDAVAALIEAHGLKLARRSGGAPLGEQTQVLLGDTMGEMFAYYAACDVAFIGGSLLPLGGQNLIEAAACGKPALTGPHTFNFAEATENAIAAGAALRVASAEEMLRQARQLLSDSTRRDTMGEAGREFCARHRGATEKTLGLIEQAMRRSSASPPLPNPLPAGERG